MKHLTESQIAMSNFPYFCYTLDWTLDSLARLGAGPSNCTLTTALPCGGQRDDPVPRP